MRYRKRPVEIDAVQWTGDNVEEVIALVGRRCFERLAELHGSTGDTAHLLMYDHLHSTWVAIRTGDWIIRGIQGETHSCRPDVFADTYEPVDQPIRYVVPTTITMAGPGPRSTAATLDEATTEAMPPSKWYECPACYHLIAAHRMGGCDAMDCECSAPHGRLVHGDRSVNFQRPTEPWTTYPYLSSGYPIGAPFMIRLEFGFAVADIERWTREHRAEMETDPDAHSHDGWVGGRLKEVMRAAGQEFVDAHTDLFAVDELY